MPYFILECPGRSLIRFTAPCAYRPFAASSLEMRNRSYRYVRQLCFIRISGTSFAMRAAGATSPGLADSQSSVGIVWQNSLMANLTVLTWRRTAVVRASLVVVLRKFERDQYGSLILAGIYVSTLFHTNHDGAATQPITQFSGSDLPRGANGTARVAVCFAGRVGSPGQY